MKKFIWILYLILAATGIWFALSDVSCIFEIFSGTSSSEDNQKSQIGRREYYIKIQFKGPAVINQKTFSELSGYTVRIGRQYSYFTANETSLNRILNIRLTTICREGAGNTLETLSCISEITQPLDLPDAYGPLIKELEIINDPKVEIIND